MQHPIVIGAFGACASCTIIHGPDAESPHVDDQGVVVVSLQIVIDAYHV